MSLPHPSRVPSGQRVVWGSVTVNDGQQQHQQHQQQQHQYQLQQQEERLLQSTDPASADQSEDEISQEQQQQQQQQQLARLRSLSPHQQMLYQQQLLQQQFQRRFNISPYGRDGATPNVSVSARKSGMHYGPVDGRTDSPSDI